MKQTELLIVGDGGHAKVIKDILEQNNYKIAVCIDKMANQDQVLDNYYTQGVNAAFVAIGDNLIRCRLGSILRQIGFKLVNAISCHSYIADNVNLGAGIAVMPGSVINTHCCVEDFAII